MAGAACRRGCVLLRTHLLGRSQIPNPCKLIRPMSSNIVNEKGHYPFDTLALLKKLKAKGVPSEHAQKTIEVIKDEFNLSRFQYELKGVQEVIKNYLDMSQFESDVKSTEAKEAFEAEGIFMKKTQELIEEYKDCFESEMNKETLRVLLIGEQFKTRMEIKANKLINVIKKNMHSYSEVKNEMKEAYIRKAHEMIEEIQAKLIEAKEWSPKIALDDHLIDGENEVEGALIKKAQELIEEIKACFRSDMNNEALRVLLKGAQELIEESKSNLDSSKFKSEIELLDGIKDILHLSEEKIITKEIPLKKEPEVTEKIKKVNLDSSQFKSDEAIKEDLILSRFKSEVKRVEEMIKKDLDIMKNDLDMLKHKFGLDESETDSETETETDLIEYKRLREEYLADLIKMLREEHQADFIKWLREEHQADLIEYKRLCEEHQADLIDGKKAQDHLVNLDRSQFKSEMNTEAKGAREENKGDPENSQQEQPEKMTVDDILYLAALSSFLLLLISSLANL